MSREQETAVAANTPPQSKPNEGKKSRQTKSKKSRKKPKKTPSELNVISRFATCGRCSYLLTAYRLTRDPADFTTAVHKIKSNWLTLTLDTKLCKLVNHTYGVRFDIEMFRVESCCPECRRAFVCKLDDSDNTPPYFRIKI
ncbi:MAG: hypothetical protein KDE48_15055 [Anaerolineales bacterium]|nr:hypothetical protein [Anaerolineales bacterium]